MTHRVLVIDNYDSFTYNLVQALAILGADVTVRRNDAITGREAVELRPTHLVVSPGPGTPAAAGRTIEIIRSMIETTPILGVCLGHQALAVVLGAKIAPALQLIHGKSSAVYHDGRTLYEGLPTPLTAGRYHSLAVSEASLPADLTVSSYTVDGEIMGVRHRFLPVEGVQFHPESVLTPDGDRLLRNFLDFESPGSF